MKIYTEQSLNSLANELANYLKSNEDKFVTINPWDAYAELKIDSDSLRELIIRFLIDQ